MGRGSRGVAEFMSRSQVKEVAAIDKMAQEDTSLKSTYAGLTSSMTVFSEGETLADKFSTVGNSLAGSYSMQYQNDEIFRDQNASSREKKRKAKEYNKKISTAKALPAMVHSKLTKLAEQFAKSAEFFNESEYELPAEMKRLMESNLDKYRTPDNADKMDMLARMKEEVPKMYKDLVNLRTLKNSAVVGNEDVEVVNYRTLLTGELAIMEAQFQMMTNMVTTYLKDISTYDQKFIGDSLIGDKVLYGDTPVMSDHYRDDLNETMKPVVIDFDKNYDEELNRLSVERSTAFRDGKDDVVNELDKQINTMRVIIKAKNEAVRVATKYNVEPQVVQQTIVDYLKAMTAGVDFRMKMSMGAFKAISLDRYKCRNGNEAYNEFVRSQFCANPGADASELIGFGYIGNGDTVDVSQKLDSTRIYGELTVTYRKDRVKDRTTFVLGNSKNRYDSMIARSVNDPDLLMCADVMEEVYVRASKVMSGEKELGTIESESSFWGDMFHYAECQYHGRLSACDIEKISLRMASKINGLSEEEIVDMLRRKKDYTLGGTSGSFEEVYKLVKVMNMNEDDFETEKGSPMDIEVYFDDAVLTLKDIDRLFEAYPANSGN